MPRERYGAPFWAGISGYKTYFFQNPRPTSIFSFLFKNKKSHAGFNRFPLMMLCPELMRKERPNGTNKAPLPPLLAGI